MLDIATSAGPATSPSAADQIAATLGRAFVEAIVAGDFDRLEALFAPDLRFRAIIPSGYREASTATGARAIVQDWFGGHRSPGAAQLDRRDGGRPTCAGIPARADGGGRTARRRAACRGGRRRHVDPRRRARLLRLSAIRNGSRWRGRDPRRGHLVRGRPRRRGAGDLRQPPSSTRRVCPARP